MAKKKRGTDKPQSVPPIRAVFLAVDSATCSGASIHVPELDRGKVVDYDILAFGEVRTQIQRRAFVEQALEAAKDENLPLIVVGEEWTRHGLSNHTFASLCENWGRWLAALEDCGVPKASVVRVKCAIWRSEVYRDFGSELPRDSENLKKLAVLFVKDLLEISCISDDIAESLLIGVWARTSGEVNVALEKVAKTCAVKRTRAVGAAAA